MESRHKEAISSCQVILTDELDIPPQLTVMRQERIFEPEHVQKITAEKNEFDQRRRFLEILPTRGPKAFDVFIQCLQSSEGQVHLAKEILAAAGELNQETTKEKASSSIKVYKETLCSSHQMSREFYCKNCETCICRKCKLTSHSHQTTVNIAPQIESSREEIQHLINQINENAEQIRKYIIQGKRQYAKSVADIAEVDSKIDSTIDALKNKLEDKRKALKEKLSKISAHCTEESKKTKYIQKTLLNKLHEQRDSLIRVLENTDQRRAIGASNDAKNFVETFSSKACPIFSWKATINNPHKTKCKSCSCDMSYSVTNTKLDDPQRLNRFPLEPSSNKVLGKKLISLSRGLSTSTVLGLAVMEGKIWVAHHQNYNLYVIPKCLEGESGFQCVETKHVFDPYYMVPFPRGAMQLVISTFTKKQLIWIKLNVKKDTWTVESEECESMAYTPYGLTATENDALLACDMENQVIHIINRKREEMRKVQLSNDMNPVKALPNRHADGYIVRDDKGKKIVRVDSYGNVVHEQTYDVDEGLDAYDITDDGDSGFYVANYKSGAVEHL